MPEDSDSEDSEEEQILKQYVDGSEYNGKFENGLKNGIGTMKYCRNSTY